MRLLQILIIFHLILFILLYAHVSILFNIHAHKCSILINYRLIITQLVAAGMSGETLRSDFDGFYHRLYLLDVGLVFILLLRFL